MKYNEKDLLRNISADCDNYWEIEDALDMYSEDTRIGNKVKVRKSVDKFDIHKPSKSKHH